ncbi:MAG: UDP-3-O-(3-hydroxymyristoyl)glucosamine N-acyltransferase [Phycisphaeraceae bacterium]
MPSHTAREIADAVDGDLIGPAGVELTGVESLADARPGQLTFIGEPAWAADWPRSRASAALVTRGVEPPADPHRTLIFVENADLALARALALFAPEPVLPEPGVHRSAVVDPTAELGEDVRIGPLCVVGPRARIGQGSVLHAQVTVMTDSQVGENCTLWPGTVIRERCTLGSRCTLHPNVSIGADGFGYRPDEDGRGLVKIPQIGTVELGDDVELGSGVCIDRGKFSATRLGDGCKIDNLVQIAHNCQLGRCVVIAGGSAIAGSVTIGDGAMLGGTVAVRDHLTVGPGARVAGGAQVVRDVPAGETWGGSPALPLREAIQQVSALRKLPDLLKQMRKRG